MIPRGYRFDREDTETSDAFIAALEAGRDADRPSQRFYHFGGAVNAEPAGEDAVRETSGFGISREIRPATLGWTYTFWGDRLQHAQWIKFTGTKPDILQHDTNNNTRGTKAKDADGNEVMAGYQTADLTVSNFIAPTGSEGGQWTVTVILLDAEQAQQDLAIVHTDTAPFADRTGFISVELRGTASSVTALNVQAKTAFNRNLSPDFAAEFSQAGAFVVRNAEPSSPNYRNTINQPTAPVATATGWAITLAPPTGTGLDADNPGAGGRVSVELAAPSVLAALATPIIGLTTPKPVIITLPA